MRLPYSWLKEFLPDLPKPDELEAVLARLGLPLESIEERPAPPDNVVFAIVKKIETIEGNLKLLELDVGRSVSVVTTADVRLDLGVLLALPGAVLPLDGDFDGMGAEVGIRTIAGHESFGMICSFKELGLSEHSALFTLPIDETAPGTNLSELWSSDFVLDIEITPNRCDVLSVIGLARELAAGLDLELILPSFDRSSSDQDYPVMIDILDSDCNRFVARLAKNVSVKPAPLWMQRKLVLSGLRPINNLVDASNYVMLEIGQPTAAYDAKDINTLVVGTSSEKFIALDGVERQLTDDLVIKSNKKIIGLAGIIGAKEGEIENTTKDVIIEAAHFDSTRLRLSAKRLGLSTEAVYRFERGVDPNLPALAADRYIDLISEIAGGQPIKGRRDAGHEVARIEIQFYPEYANEFLGTEFELEAMHEALESLGCEIEEIEQVEDMQSFIHALDVDVDFEFRETIWKVKPPTYRFDLQIEEDLIEEVARIIGYDQIPETLPYIDEAELIAPDFKRGLKDIFVGLGFQEVVTYSFTSPEFAEKTLSNEPFCFLKNPQNNERTALRADLYPGLLPIIAQSKTLIFEIGRVFTKNGEEDRLTLMMRGDFAPKNWINSIETNFYTFKGLLESAAKRLGATFNVEPNKFSYLHPGISGEIIWNGQIVGSIGAIHPKILSNFDIKDDVFLAEITLPLPKRPWIFTDPSRQPPAWRDLAVVTPKNTAFSMLSKLISSVSSEILTSIEPFDIYTGQPIPENYKSVGLKLRFQDLGRTLTDEEIESEMAKIIICIEENGWNIRK